MIRGRWVLLGCTLLIATATVVVWREEIFNIIMMWVLFKNRQPGL